VIGSVTIIVEFSFFIIIIVIRLKTSMDKKTIFGMVILLMVAMGTKAQDVDLEQLETEDSKNSS
jgi:hypothetical protein